MLIRKLYHYYLVFLKFLILLLLLHHLMYNLHVMILQKHPNHRRHRRHSRADYHDKRRMCCLLLHYLHYHLQYLIPIYMLVLQYHLIHQFRVIFFHLHLHLRSIVDLPDLLHHPLHRLRVHLERMQSVHQSMLFRMNR